MDPSHHYSQDPSYQNQYQAQLNHGTNNQQLVPGSTAGMNHYLQLLHNNTSLQTPAPSNDPAFFDRGFQGLLEAKHKIEHMMLVLRQRSEMANMANTSVPDDGQAQNASQAGFAHPQVHHQPSNQGSMYQNPTWANQSVDQWAYPQQDFVSQGQPVRSAQVSPEVQMMELHSGQRHTQDAQMGVASHPTSFHQPQQHAQSLQQVQMQPRAQLQQPQQYVQPQQPQQYVQPQQTQQYMQSQQTVQPQRAAPLQQHAQTYTQSQPIASGSQHWSQPQPSQIFRPQPQHPPRRHPLEPSEHSQGGPSQPRQAQQERDQVATAQRQQQYLHSLQQRQHPQQGSSGASITQQQASASQAAQPIANVTPAPLAHNSSSAQPNALSNAARAPVNADLSGTHSPSPHRLPRSAPSITLQDLRPARRRNASANHGFDRTNGNNDNPNQEAGPAIVVPNGDVNSVDLPTLSSQSGATAIQSSNLPTFPAGSLRPAQTPAAIRVQVLPTSRSNLTHTPSASNTPVPVVANGVPAPPAASATAQTGTTAQPSNSSQSTANGAAAPLKGLLERLHRHGVDCVAIVREAAEASGAPTDHLHQPSASVLSNGQPASLFYPGQPLTRWMQSLKVSRAQGSLVLKFLWEKAGEKARELGLEDLPTSQTGTPVVSTVPLAGSSTPTTSSNAQLPPQTTHPAQAQRVESQSVRSSAPPTTPSTPTNPVHIHRQHVPEQRAVPGQHPVQASFNAPSLQHQGPRTQVETYNASLAEHHRRPGPHPSHPPHPVAQRPQVGAQYAYLSHPIYQRVQAQTQPAVVQQTQSVSRPPPAAPVAPNTMSGGTPALNLLQAFGLMSSDKEPSPIESDAESDTSKESKGKGKAKATDEIDDPAATQLSDPPTTEITNWTYNEEANILATNKSPPENVAPVALSESLPVQKHISGPLPATPPSPLLVPTIATLAEPRSPSTTASEFAEPADGSPTHTNMSPARGEGSALELYVDMAPAPPARFSPVSSTAPDIAPNDVRMASPVEPDQLRVSSSPSRPTSALPPSSPHQSALRPTSSASQHAPTLPEYAPLKRKRDSRPSSGPERESWVIGYARTANELSELNRAKRARSERRASAIASGSRGAAPTSAPSPNKDKGKSKAQPLFRPKTPTPTPPPSKPKTPLFRPETPSDEDEIVDVIGRSSSPVAERRPQQNGKRRMIMEVVIPTRKKPVSRVKTAGV